MTGSETATASPLWEWESENVQPPQSDEVHVLLDWNNDVPGILTNVAVDITPFRDVSAQFAALEGEGDLGLEYWSRVHWKYFESVCHDIARVPTEDMPVVCQEFVFSRLASDG